jgi:SAM-dependent methyltransferase
VFWGHRPAGRDRALSRLFFSISAREWARRGTSAEHLAPFVDGLAKCREPREVLDLGTGAGATAAHVAAAYPSARVVGVDLSARMIRVAAERHRAPNLEFHRASVEQLPFESSRFDLVCMMNALPELEELARVATDDAQLLAANTYFAPEGPWMDAWLERWRSVGFVRTDMGLVGRGGWQLFEREAP